MKRRVKWPHDWLRDNYTDWFDDSLTGCLLCLDELLILFIYGYVYGFMGVASAVYILPLQNNRLVYNCRQEFCEFSAENSVRFGKQVDFTGAHLSGLSVNEYFIMRSTQNAVEL